MMILLSLIAVGLLSLSSISIRASANTLAQAEARSNARMAAMMAIAQLQELTGLDTRVTASAKLVDQSNIDVTGVWRSWEGTNHDQDGKPIAPDYNSKSQVGDPSEAFGREGSGRFLGWLTNTSLGELASATEVPESSTVSVAGNVKMVSSGTLDDADEVYLTPTIISSEDGTEEGAFSWWTTGDNSKALIRAASAEEEPQSESDWQQRLRGNRSPDPEIFGLSELDEMTEEDLFIASRGSLDLVEGASLNGDEFYDLTTFSRGLLTNVATGGWRKDLSTFSELYNEFPGSRGGSATLPLFANEPGESLLFARTTESDRPSNALLYHWSDYLANASDANWRQTPAVCSWTALVNYMKLYEDLRSSSTSSLEMNPTRGKVGSGADRFDFQEEIRIHPQVARVQWVLSLGSIQVSRQQPIMPGIVVTPIVTLWNPYNVSLSVSDYQINFDEVFPLRLSYEIGSRAFNDVSLRSIASNRILTTFPTVTLGPGESKVYGMDGTAPVINTGSQTLVLTEGYEPNGGALFTGLDNGNAIIDASASDKFEITRVDFAASGLEGLENDEDGIGVRFQVNSGGTRNIQIIVMSYSVADFGLGVRGGGAGVINSLYPPIVTSIKNLTVGEVEGLQNRPFATATLGLRMVSQPPADNRFSAILTKGALQSNPLQHYAELGAASDNSSNSNALVDLAGSGASHPINAPYDFVIQEASDWDDDAVTVQFDPSSNRGYIVSGTLPADGVSRCVIAELPTRPLQSLADLQHFDVRNNNQQPPFQFNLIGNASAHPIFGPDQVSVETTGSFGGLTNDDSYLLNHILFDDWFLSSIAPDLQNFSAREERSAEDVMTDFLEGEEPLPNQFYLASDLANDLDPDEAAEEFLSGDPDSDTGLFPFQTVASLLEVEGMFNVNSVSVDAWRAVLKQNRNLEVPHFTDGGSVTTEESENPAFPRTTVASDVNTFGSSVTGTASGAIVGGYAALTDAQIDALAEEIVEQVRERGPFLSLSEFVNRQLSQNTDLALAGTIQRALDMLQERSSDENPFLDLIQAGQNITTEPSGNADYKFPEAAFGSTNFGVPGWVRQADVLRPLAPIISARDDTFTIRAYGDSRDASGDIVAQAWCELLVQRNADYVDKVDSAEVIPHSDEMISAANRRFGRRYQLVAFRWLNEDEV